MIGRTVGRYHIVGKLGEGGMGSVWKAEDKLLGRTVAIKFLPESLAASPDARRRFLRGARAAAELDHPGIATIYDAGEAGGLLYVAGALVDGATVIEMVGKGPLPVAEAVRIARDAAAALQHAHGRGVIHRDVSGGNIMVARDGRVTVLDFGLAKAAGGATSRVTKTGLALGTVAYMAPEVAIGRPADARADIYGLGAVTYQMVTGSLPFVADRPEALLYKAVHEPLRSPTRPGRRLPPALVRILLKALAKDPEKRYSSAGALLADLRALAPQTDGDHDRRPPARRAATRGTANRERSPPRKFSRRIRPGAMPDTLILLVLPFHDLLVSEGQGSGAHALARGLAETLGARLSRVAGVQVIPPTAVPTGQAPDADPRGLGRSFGASLVLHGTVQRPGRRLRVTWSLVGGKDGVQIAGDTVDGYARDLLALEDRLVRSVVRALELEATSSRPVVHARPADPAAREHYLQALGHLQRHGDEVSIDGAIRLLERLAEGGEGTSHVWAALGRAYLAKYRLTLDRVWVDRGRRACARALQRDPDSPEVLLTLGHLHNTVGRYAAATRVLRQSLKARSGDLDAVLALAAAYEGAGKVEEAERTCREALALRPTYWAGFNRLGTLYFRVGRYEEAAQLFRRVVEVAPDSARGHTNLASSYYQLGRWEDAIAAYQRSLDLQPTASAFTSLGTVHFFMGHYDQAAAIFERGAALRPFDPAQWGNLADAYRWMPGQEEKSALAYEQAIRLVRDQLELNPNQGRYWARLADWLAKRGQSREAVRALRRGMRLVPRDLSCMVHAVVVYELAGERAKALEWLEQVVAHGYDRAELERDPELASLRQDPSFHRIIKEVQAV